MPKFHPAKKKRTFFQNSKPAEDEGGADESKPSFFWKAKQHLSFLKWLDPFTYVDLFVVPRVKSFSDSELLEFLVNIFFAFIFAWLAYSVLGFLLGSSTPLVIVYSASMEPTFYRGDVILLGNAATASDLSQRVVLDRNIGQTPVVDFAQVQYDSGALSSIIFDKNQEIFPNKQGSVVVYSAYPSGLPIIHRAIVSISAWDGNFLLTKGDNSLTNPTFDEDCGKIISSAFPSKQCISFYPVPLDELHGKALLVIPKIGCVKLWLVDDLSSIISTGRLPSDFRGFC